jgi:hypothetical protein
VFVVVILLAGASSAYADAILNYQISGPVPNGTFTASFTLSQHPTPRELLLFKAVPYFALFPVDV